MKAVLIVLAVIALGIVLFGSHLLDERSQIIADKNEIDARWAQVDSDMKKRADRLSTLLEGAKGDAKPSEEPVIREVANARASILNTGGKQDEINANNRLDDAIPRLLLLQKRNQGAGHYEDLTAIRDELEQEENQIAVDRRDYNAAMTKYNTDIELFPKNIAAEIFGFRHDDAYFTKTRQ